MDDIIVVDNGSTDGGPKQIRLAFPHINIIELRENIGLSQARNIGLSTARNDLVLLVDDDVYLSNNALHLMINSLEKMEATIVCPRITFYPETDTIQCDGADIHFAGTLSLRHAYQPVSGHQPQRTMVKGFIGACMLVKRKALLELGNFDEDYFFYFEDMELSYRLLALGHSICCEERAIVRHERGAGTKDLSFRGSGPYPERRAYFNIRNRWLTIWIHYQLRTLFILSPALLLYECAAFVEIVRRGWLRLYFNALSSLISEWTSIMQRRKHWETKRKVNDGEILNGGPLPLSRGFVDGRNRLVQLLNKLLNSYWEMAKRWL